jgi:predicted phage terminase large subunit-like protein
LKAEKARRSLYEFVRQAWPVLEPEVAFVDGLHVHAICEHLQSVTQGKIRNLIVNVPPGHAKSLLTAVFWPAWAWIDRPESRWLFSSYSSILSVRDSVKCRRLVESSWYEERWGDRFQLTSDQNQKARFENNRTGARIATSVGGSATGERGDYVVVDDPHSVDQAASDIERRAALEWWNGTMSTRLNDFRTGHKVVIQQRLHEADLTGDLLARGGYELLMLPAEFEPERRCSTSIGWTDPRKEYGELLWQARVTHEDLARLKIDLGSYRYAGQYQQRPSPAEGGIFKRSWWRYWRPRHLELSPVQIRMPDGEIKSIPAVPLPEQFDQMLQSWDMTFKDLSTSDYVVGQVWSAIKADRFLLDQRRDRLNMPATKAAVKAMSEKWPAATAKLVEDRANGSAVIAELQHDVSGLIAVEPQGSKIARAQAVSPQVESGNVYLPHPAIAGWTEPLVEECANFPNGRFDDCVDALSQALNRLRGGRSGIMEYYAQGCEELARRRGVTLEQLLANPGLSRGETVRRRSWPALLA